MLERGVLGLGVLILVVPMSFIGVSAGGRFVERDERPLIVTEPTIVRIDSEQPHALEAEGGNHLLRRLFWTITTMTGVLAPVAYLHACWTGQDEAYVRFQQALLFATWEALKGMPEGMVASVAAIPMFASSIYQDPSLLLQMVGSTISQVFEQGYAFATVEDDEEAARIASSTVADFWFGKLLAAGGVGTRAALKSHWATRAARAVDRFTHPKPKLKLAAAGFCFVAGTLVHSAAGAQAIEDVAIGARVLTTNGVARLPTEVDASWRRIDLVMHDARSADGKIRIAVLRSLKWVEESGAKPGREIEIVLDEMGVRGRARVVGLSRVPAIAEGTGRVVLSTIQSKSDDVRALRFVETNEKLEPTASHRLYSLDRSAFVAVRDLRIGERLRTRAGALTIASITRKPGTHTVYNLEVEHDHEYFVSRSAVLSHNDDVGSCAAPVAWAPTRGFPAVSSELWSDAMRNEMIDTFKARFRFVFERSRLTRGTFATNIGVDRATIRMYLDPEYRHLPTTRALLGLARAEKVSADWMLGHGTHGPDIDVRPLATTTVQRLPRNTARPIPVMTAALRNDALIAFKRRFTALAIRSGMTDQAFAENIGRARGIARHHVAEKYDKLPGVESLVVLSKQEDVRIDWLLGLIDDGAPNVSKELLEQADALVAQPIRPHRSRVSASETMRTDELRAEIAPGVRERLGQVFSEARLSNAAFGRKTRTSGNLLHQLATSPNRVPSAHVLLRIARSESVSIDWVLGTISERPVMTKLQSATAALSPEDVFRQRLAEVIARSNESQSAFAKRLGISDGVVNRYLSADNHLPDTEILVLIARSENVRIDWLLGLIDD